MFLKSLRFVASSADASLFVLHDAESFLATAAYADDLLETGSLDGFIQSFLKLS